MYKALKRSHRELPKVFQVNLEDHEKAQDIICFDFVPALLSLLQDCLWSNLLQQMELFWPQ
jgi:hypothetical protein